MHACTHIHTNVSSLSLSPSLSHTHTHAHTQIHTTSVPLSVSLSLQTALAKNMAIMFIVSNLWLGYTFLRIQVLKESCWYCLSPPHSSPSLSVFSLSHGQTLSFFFFQIGFSFPLWEERMPIQVEDLKMCLICSLTRTHSLSLFVCVC